MNGAIGKWLTTSFFLLLALSVSVWGETPPVKKSTGKNPPASSSPGISQPKGPDSQAAGGDSIKATAPVRLENARIDAIDSDYANMALTDCVPSQPDPHQIVCNGRAFRPKVNDLALRAKLKPYSVGDHVRIEINEKNEVQDIFGPWSLPVCSNNRLVVLTVCALLLLGFAIAVTKGRPLKFIISPEDNRYSNSKFQMALWFWVLLSTYGATVVLRLWYAGWDFFGAVSIPENLLLLSGLSAITYGGAKAITTRKVDEAQHPVNPPGTVVPRLPNPNPKHALMPGQERFFGDLLQNDAGEFDFGDFQMLVVTLVAVGMYVTLIFHFLGSIEFLKTAKLPDVDTTILAAFGLGQGAYLAKKAGGQAGQS